MGTITRPSRVLIHGFIVVLILVATSCSAPQQPSAQTQLKIIFRADGEKVTAQHTLDCNGEKATNTSTLPDALAACASLEKLTTLVNSSPNPTKVCTQIYGGPQRAQVSGLLRGQAVNLEFSRSDGCLISQWDAAKFLLDSGT